MSITARTGGRDEPAAGLAAERLRAVFVRQADAVVACMGEDEPSWRAGVSVLEAAAEAARARNLARLSEAAAQLGSGAEGHAQRRRARRALRLAARLDAR